jgi:tetratricopeptide (TPR) repeat protein
MTLYSNPGTTITLENFDDAWALGYPAAVEKKLYEMLPQAESLKDKSIYLQMLSQIALAQAMQQKFDQAHKTLDEAQTLTLEYPLAQVRILLERGRVFQQQAYQQQGTTVQALNYFKQSFELSKKHGFDCHTINAAHMVAIVVDVVEDKIHWNQLAIEMAAHTQDKRAYAWLGSLYNNLARNYIDAQQYDNALVEFQKALEFRIQEGYAPNIRVARWSVGNALRLLGRLDEALDIQKNLVKEYETAAKNGTYEMPVEMFTLVRGWVYEEIAEIYAAQAKQYAQLAYDDLSPDAMFKTVGAARLERLQEIKNKL